jgi:predicted DNA-binding WGR domain protein
VESLCIRLEARSVAHRCFRAYGIDVSQDLFGAWMVEMNYGRIGTMGRTKVRSFGTTEQVQAKVDICLRKRSTAPRRIGVDYRLRRIVRFRGWRQPALDNWLGARGFDGGDHPATDDLP